MKRTILALTIILSLSTSSLLAVTTYIGDVDGFGFGAAVGLKGVDGNPADRNNNGILDSGDVLPDLNQNGIVAWGNGDDFDNRSAAEAADPYAKWTDVALSRNYSGSPGLADLAEFVFTFAVPTIGDADYGQDHFVNFVYGDYDVNPMTANVEGTDITLLGNNAGGLDGYIWRAYAPVSWADMLDGQVSIQITAPNEPYVTFDYALLDTAPINPTIPAPGALLLGSIGLSIVGWIKQKKAC